jgi:polyhydroxyalkanoate synthase subunit PhaC
VDAAEQHTDSWWPDFAEWFAERGGKKKDAPEALGGAGMAPIELAPGSYVLQK